MQLREVWLERAASYLLDYMVQQGLPRVVVRVSCGWPSLCGLAARVVVVGQCFPPTMSKDGVQHIFVSPRLDDSIQGVGSLLYALMHAAIGCLFGHRKECSQAARRLHVLNCSPALLIVLIAEVLFASFSYQMSEVCAALLEHNAALVAAIQRLVLLVLTQQHN